TIRTTGVRGPRLFAILEGMQSSRALRALPVALWLAPTLSLAAQARYRVTTNGAWFYQEPEGKRLARLARGTIGVGGEAEAGWVEKAAVESLAQVASAQRDSGAPEPPERGPGVGLPDSNASSPSAPVDPSRVESARRTVLYRAPEGAPTGTLAPSAPLRVLGRSGDWTRVELEGWVKSADLEIAPPGVLMGITAAELRTDPQRYAGQVLRWTLQYIAAQQADELRPEIPTGARYFLARGPLPEHGFVYVIVPDAKRAQL